MLLSGIYTKLCLGASIKSFGGDKFEVKYRKTPVSLQHHVIPGAGHACYIEGPATFDEDVWSFLKKHKFHRCMKV